MEGAADERLAEARFCKGKRLRARAIYRHTLDRVSELDRRLTGAALDLFALAVEVGDLIQMDSGPGRLLAE
jgi:hypothetical protein